MTERLPFITGSHAYGTPNKDSDVDLVMMLPLVVGLETVITCLVKINENTYISPFPDGHYSFKFGKLNIIVPPDNDNYDLWKKGTEELKQRKPVTRDEAIVVFMKLGLTNKVSNQ